MSSPLPEAPFQVLVIQAYTPREKTELAFRKDEILTVLEVDVRGQRFRATRDPKGKKPVTGWLPMYYVRVVDMMSEKEKRAVAQAVAAAPSASSISNSARNVGGGKQDGSNAAPLGGSAKEHASVAELVERGDSKKLAKALRKGRSLEETNAAGKTALQIAAEKGDAETVAMLIKAGAQINTPDSRGWTPLHFAALNTRTEVCEVLLRSNADPNAQTSESGTTALHLFVRASWTKEVERALSALVQRSANLELKNKYGETALHQAVSRLNSDGISFLIKHGADLNARNEFGETSLHKAARIGKPAKEVIKQLLSAGCDPTIEGRNGTAADLIDFDAHPELRELFPEEEDDDSSSATSSNANDDVTPPHSTHHTGLPPLGTPSVSDEPSSSISNVPVRSWVTVSAAHTQGGDKSPRAPLQTTASARSLGPPPARSAPMRVGVHGPSSGANSGSNSPVVPHILAPSPAPPPSSDFAPMPPPKHLVEPVFESAMPLPALPGSSPVPQSTLVSALQVPQPARMNISPERPLAPTISPSTPPTLSQAGRKQTAKISMIQSAYQQQVEAHQKVDTATLKHRENVAKRVGRGVSPQRGAGEPAPSFFSQPRDVRAGPAATLSTPISASGSASANSSPMPVRPAAAVTVSAAMTSGSGSGRMLAVSPVSPRNSPAPHTLDIPTPLSTSNHSNAIASLPAPAALPPPPPSDKFPSPPLSPTVPPKSTTPPPSVSTQMAPSSPPKSEPSSGNGSNANAMLAKVATSSSLMAVAAQRRMSRKQRGSRMIKSENAERELERLSDAERVAETASALEERAFVWRATQHLDANDIRTEIAKIAAETNPASPPPRVSPPAAAAPAAVDRMTPEALHESRPALINTTHGFWVESGAANANPDMGVNMSDFTDFYRLYFYGRKQCTYVGYLPVMKINTSNPTIVSVLEEAESDKLEKLSHRGLIRTKSGVDHFYVNAEAFAKATASVKGKFLDKMVKYLADTYFPGSQLWPVREKELISVIEAELLQFEEKDPERVPCFAFACVYAQQGDKTAIDMMNHEHSSSGFDEFIDWLGDRIELRGWSGFKGGLDVRGDAKGTHSIYTKYMNKFEIMFHVSTLLPFHELDPLKLVRTRQVQNDVLMLIYMEGDTATYDPLIMPTNVTHCFVIVNPTTVNGEQMYRVSVCSRSVVPHFTPELPYPPLFRRDEKFRHFLLNKLLNGQMAARKSGLHLMYTRPRQAMIRDIINKYIPEKDRQNTQLG